MSQSRARSSLGAVMLLGLCVAGCPATLSDEERAYFEDRVSGTGGGGGSGGACDAPTLVFLKQINNQVIGCAAAACHSPPINQSNMDLSVANPFPALLDRPADTTQTSSLCGSSGKKLIDSANPEQSLLYTKMLASSDPLWPGCGLAMPYGLPSAQASEQECVLSWIQAQLAESGGTGGSSGTGGGSGTGGEGGAGGDAAFED